MKWQRGGRQGGLTSWALRRWRGTACASLPVFICAFLRISSSCQCAFNFRHATGCAFLGHVICFVGPKYSCFKRALSEFNWCKTQSLKPESLTEWFTYLYFASMYTRRLFISWGFWFSKEIMDTSRNRGTANLRSRSHWSFPSHDSSIVPLDLTSTLRRFRACDFLLCRTASHSVCSFVPSDPFESHSFSAGTGGPVDAFGLSAQLRGGHTPLSSSKSCAIKMQVILCNIHFKIGQKLLNLS
jgi:hypothetical protein